MFANKAIDLILKYYSFDTVLDIGSGCGQHAQLFLDNNKKVTCVDNGNSIYFNKNILDSSKLELILCNFINFNTDKKYDVVWCSHILEHQKNVGFFLEKCYSLLNDSGLLCVTVPPMKTTIVGGHLTVWNMGLLLYNLVINGIDCSKAHCGVYDYNISVIVKKQPKINIDSLNLSYDYGDLEKLQSFFPTPILQNSNGNIKNINWI